MEAGEAGTRSESSTKSAAQPGGRSLCALLLGFMSTPCQGKGLRCRVVREVRSEVPAARMTREGTAEDTQAHCPLAKAAPWAGMSRSFVSLVLPCLLPAACGCPMWPPASPPCHGSLGPPPSSGPCFVPHRKISQISAPSGPWPAWCRIASPVDNWLAPVADAMPPLPHGCPRVPQPPDLPIY